MNYLTTVRTPRTLRAMDDFDRMFDALLSPTTERSVRSPRVDIRESDDAYTIEADMPGLSENEIDVHVENDLLVISAEAEKKDETTTDGWIVRERSRRSFYRSFSVPRDGDADKVNATYRNGVLTVTLAKREDAKPRQIKIERA